MSKHANLAGVRAYKTKGAAMAAESARRRARERRQKEAKELCAYEGTNLTTEQIAELHQQRKAEFLQRQNARAAA